jgi:hypothetical protein
MTRIGERAPDRWRLTRLEGARDGHCGTVSVLRITRGRRRRPPAFLASCLDRTPVRPPVTAADQDPVGAASVLDHRGVDAVDGGTWIPRLCLRENDAAKRVPDGRSPKARVYIRKHERSSRINPPRVPFLTTRVAQFYKQKPFNRKALGQALWSMRLFHVGTRFAKGVTGGADDSGG